MKLLTLSLVFSCLLIIVPENSIGYRILGVFPFNAKSHFMMFEALMKGLALKGHQVDVISPFPQKKPFKNYNDIMEFYTKSPALMNNMTYDAFNTMSVNIVQFVSEKLGNDICEGLEDPEMLQLIRNPPKNPPYDLVITEVFSAHCFMAFGYHLKVPTIGVSSAVLYPWANRMIGNPANLAFSPNNLIDYIAPMTFWQRLHNTVHAIYSEIAFQYYTKPQDKIIKKIFGPNAPGVRESERNLALVLTNSHPTLNDPRPITPSLIEVGGLHVQDYGEKLPRDLEEWMDESKDGFVYFTFGSMVMIESFPEEVLKIFYKSLGKINPVRVLIKVPNPEKLPPGLPKNFRTFSWAPQFKVLKHKNIKAFITHGGLMGGQEAIHCAVPMIAMPLFGDQFRNVDQYERKKIAIKLNAKKITEEKLDAALNEILFNPVWKKTIDKVSQEYLDRPMSAMETAIWWVEYVVRHGSNTLRSPAMDLTWWQIELFDVYAFLLLIAILILIFVSKLIRFVINIIFAMPRVMISNSKKSQ